MSSTLEKAPIVYRENGASGNLTRYAGRRNEQRGTLQLTQAIHKKNDGHQ